jgi:hypothetical protein
LSNITQIGDPYYNSSLIKDKCKDDNIKQ